MIEERGFQLVYPPAYSADLNPIEQALSQIKGLGVRPKPGLLGKPWSRQLVEHSRRSPPGMLVVSLSTAASGCRFNRYDQPL
jgi:hypothetical protein